METNRMIFYHAVCRPSYDGCTGRAKEIYICIFESQMSNNINNGHNTHMCAIHMKISLNRIATNSISFSVKISPKPYITMEYNNNRIQIGASKKLFLRFYVVVVGVCFGEQFIFAWRAQDNSNLIYFTWYLCTFVAHKTTNLENNLRKCLFV